jgi:hypothetical protein
MCVFITICLYYTFSLPCKIPKSRFPASGSSVVLTFVQAMRPPVCYSPQGGWLMWFQSNSVRHEFPLWATVLPSGPSPCTWLSHAQSTMPDKTPQTHTASWLTCPFPVQPLYPSAVRFPGTCPFRVSNPDGFMFELRSGTLGASRVL